MSSIYNHRPMAVGMPGRFNELIESLKQEFEVLNQELSSYKLQQSDIDHKFNQQIQEITSFQQSLFELDRSHTKIKQQYEEEIMRLRRELESRTGISAAPSQATQATNPPPTPAPPPNLGGSAMFNTPTTGLAPVENYPQVAPSYPNGSATKRARGENNAAFPTTPTPTPPDITEHKESKGSKRKAAAERAAAASAAAAAANVTLANPSKGSVADHAGKVHPLSGQASNNTIAIQSPPHSNQPASPTSANEFDLESIPASSKREGSDWLLIFNQKLPPALDIDLAHNIEHTSVVCCIKFSNDSKYLATGCNRSAQIFDVATGNKVSEFSDSNNKEGDLYIRSVCFSPDGQFLATGAEDKQIRIWDIKKNKIRHLFTGHEQDIYSLDFSRDGRFVVSGSGDRTARIWNIETGKPVFVLGNDEASSSKDAGITSVAISPDGRFVAAGSLDRIVRVWDAKNGHILDRFEGHKDSVYSVAFSPDGRTLVSGSLDKTLKLWELNSPRSASRSSVCKMTFTGHKDFVLSVGFSPDGKWIVSGSKDRSVQFWDPHTGVISAILQGHKNSVISVALSPDSQYFATGSGDCKARIWKYESK